MEVNTDTTDNGRASTQREGEQRHGNGDARRGMRPTERPTAEAARKDYLLLARSAGVEPLGYAEWSTHWRAANLPPGY